MSTRHGLWLRISDRSRERWRIVRGSATLLVGTGILLFWIACALFGSHIAPLDPYADDLLITLAPPSRDHWFGTDQLGRDVFARVIAGAHDILLIAPLATLVGTVAGTAVGLCIGFFPRLDALLSRVIEALQALPLVIVALLALAAVGTSTLTVVLVIGFVFTPIIARTIRAAVQVECSLYSVVASLSFIGFGIQPPSADWGLAIAENYSLIGSYPWVVLFDAAATASLVVAVNLVKDGLHRVFEV